MGTLVDPDQMISAHKAGMSFEEVHRRAYGGEFLPSAHVDPSVMLQRNSRIKHHEEQDITKSSTTEGQQQQQRENP